MTQPTKNHSSLVHYNQKETKSDSQKDSDVLPLANSGSSPSDLLSTNISKDELEKWKRQPTKENQNLPCSCIFKPDGKKSYVCERCKSLQPTKEIKELIKEEIEALKPIYKKIEYFRKRYGNSNSQRDLSILCSILYLDFGVKVPLKKIRINGRYIKSITYNFITALLQKAYLSGRIDVKLGKKLKQIKEKK